MPQNPDLWKQPKLVFRDIVERPTFWLDIEGAVVNGDCYWLTCDDPDDTDLLWLAAAVGNSTFIERFYDYRFNNKLYSGRRRFMTQYVESFPLPDPTGSIGKKIISKARLLYDAIPSADDGSLCEELNAMVWEAFGLGISVGEQVGDRDTERAGEGLQGAQGDVALAAFDRADVGAVQAAGVSERLLRQVSCGSQRADVGGKDLSQGAAGTPELLIGHYGAGDESCAGDAYGSTDYK